MLKLGFPDSIRLILAANQIGVGSRLRFVQRARTNCQPRVVVYCGGSHAWVTSATISFKTEDSTYKQCIQSDLDVDMIDKSLDEPIQSDNEDYILRKIREDYLADSTVTIHLIGQYSAELRGKEEQRFIKRELQASLYNSEVQFAEWNPRSCVAKCRRRHLQG